MAEADMDVLGATQALSREAGQSHGGRRYKGTFSVSTWSKLGEALTTRGLCSPGCKVTSGTSCSLSIFPALLLLGWRKGMVRTWYQGRFRDNDKTWRG